ncbi:hypothetical protein JOC76_005391 [Neobacillus cucumis]|uniref:hypothetical protein n=1 Tax=Neobacillus cucumis TaxID=1740721 RepID=UPI0019635744|nr:hypothetical protein [Neobacillus cucumis]MBM7655855.1 hypothetical protein [Neobacillus cucumis]
MDASTGTRAKNQFFRVTESLAIPRRDFNLRHYLNQSQQSLHDGKTNHPPSLNTIKINMVKQDLKKQKNR